jgi:hypothetical protein
VGLAPPFVVRQTVTESGHAPTYDDAGGPEHRHRGGSGAGEGRGRKGVASGAGGLAGVPGVEQDVVVAVGGGG